MKIRSGFVSNSSSSSFIVTEDLSKKMGISCLELNSEQIELLTGYRMWEDDVETFNPETGKKYYLTEFVSDSRDEWGTIKHDIGYSFEYQSGGHWGPYDEENYNEYPIGGNSVWLRKEHDVAKQMTFGNFINDFLENYGNREVIVKYEGDGIKLTIIGE